MDLGINLINYFMAVPVNDTINYTYSQCTSNPEVEFIDALKRWIV